MTEDELLKRHPRVWHMAADGMWHSIQRHGLLSVSALLDLFEVTGAKREAIEAQRRPESVALSHPEHGHAIVRDNKPMTDAGLIKCLQDNLSPSDWYRILNRKSFFWASRERLERLLGARAYAQHAQTILEVDTAQLIDRHRDQLRLARINSGQTFYVPQPRGTGTFMRIADFPDGEGRLGTKQRPHVVELVVDGGVPDIAEMVIRVDRVEQGAATQLWP